MKKTETMSENTTQSVPKLTEAQKTWEMIKNLPLDLFGLPGQTVEQNCTVVPAGPDELYLTIKAGAVLPALEAAIAPHQFVPELDGKYVIIKKVPKKPV